MHKKLFIPGPIDCRPEVLEKLSQPMIGHRTKECTEIGQRIMANMQKIWKTKNVVVISTTSGSGLMESAIKCCTAKRAACFSVGSFGDRWHKMATTNGVEADIFRSEEGKCTTPEMVEEALATGKYDLITVTHNETSSGVMNPVGEIAKVVAKYPDVVFCVDSVSSAGGADIPVDEWGIDIFYSGSQKCLSVPPGLAPASFSDAAMEVIAKRRSRVPNWYLDVSLIRKYWEGSPRVYHHTAPINMYYGLHQALDNLLSEGLEAAFARHEAMHRRLIDGLGKLGFTPFAKEGGAPQINLFLPPAGVDANTLRATLRKEHKIEVAGGLGDLAGKVIRVGVMGEGAREEPIDRLINAISLCMNK